MAAQKQALMKQKLNERGGLEAAITSNKNQGNALPINKTYHHHHHF